MLPVPAGSVFPGLDEGLRPDGEVGRKAWPDPAASGRVAWRSAPRRRSLRMGTPSMSGLGNGFRQLRGRLGRLLSRRPAGAPPAQPEVPLRARLLTAEQIRQRGAELARTHRVATRDRPDRLLVRLADSQQLLQQAVELLTQTAQAQRSLTPAGEWLLDNIHVIEEQIRIARRHLPKGYSRELPQLESGPSAGSPRVYDIALTAISHGDGRFDADGLSGFLTAYQKVTALRLGELWAVPIMLRLALIENLRRVSACVIVDTLHRKQADGWADRLIDAADTEPGNLVLVMADMVRSTPPMAGAFVAELARRLQGRSAALAMPLNWIERWLASAGQSTERMVQAESQQQAADQVTISNGICSLRLLATIDWRDFVESMSAVEAALREDPDGTYARMDFATRDGYRHVVERLARSVGRAEPEVARQAVALAAASVGADEADPVASHVGYFLVDAGLPALRRSLQPGRRPWRRPARAVLRFPLPAYLLPIAIITGLFSHGLVASAAGAVSAPALLWPVILLCVLAFSELGIALVNWSATLLALPRVLPRLDFSAGIPASARTLVVIPSMFGSARGVAMLAEALEVRFLANRDANLHFALLTDFFDADVAERDEDRGLLDAAQREIDRLNTRHASGQADRFFLFHRPRQWNPAEGVWMGHERKRGKLAALNRMLRDGDTSGFLRVAGDTRALGGVKFVITLDTDTQLPRDAARELAGTLAHPLNRARFDARRRCVIGGYGILQPRVGASMRGERQSWYSRIHGSEPGIDPYTRAISDVYQDLFGEGSFVGKGIYAVDAFEHVLADRLPENSVLSHDLLEGCYARAGLVSDVQLYEDYPARYALDVKRRHRWIRGDWQLLPWLLPWVQRMDRRWERNPLSMLSRGKVLDNLRRSLQSTATTALLVIGWLLMAQPAQWMLWVLSILFVPPLVASLVDLLSKPADMGLKSHLRQAFHAAVANFRRAPVALACLPYEAWFSLDAIARTLWRVLVSRRGMLRWSPSSEVERTSSDSLMASVRAMWVAPLTAFALLAAILALNPSALLLAAPVLLLWAVSPLLMWWLGRPRARRPAALSRQQTAFLGRLARRIWMFFEVHVTAADHWLPPDNVQEHPARVVARRTSPTNIGLGLLANLTALDFGYLSPGAMLVRVASTLATLEQLARHRGHFYNWYDTETLQPLPPHYVSSVDSGNLAGHLLTLRQGLLAQIDAPVLAPRVFQGLADTLDVLRGEREAVLPEVLEQAMRESIAAALVTPPDSLGSAVAALRALLELARSVETANLGGPVEARRWSAAIVGQCACALDDLRVVAPGLGTGNAAPAGAERPAMPSLRQLAAATAAPDTGVTSERAPDGERGPARARILEIERLAHIAGQCAQMQFDFLYDASRHLLAIGCNVEERRLDDGVYDLLASEARLCTFVAIAQGQLPQEAWFALGRLLTEVDGQPALLSWSGSMFEYLMPHLVMPSYEGTLLDQTARAVVDRQISYGRQHGLPWGISESGYSTVDARMNYQYRAFGVPGLGLQRGLGEDLVIAPYASMLALMVAPEEACSNLQRLSEAGYSGAYGLFEAIDFTPARMPRGQRQVVVRSFMAHHQGMGLLALSHLLHGQPMQHRFAADPEFQATLLLLQERTPRTGAYLPHVLGTIEAPSGSEDGETRLRVFRSPDSARPAVQMLSNGRYHVMLTSAGGGYSRLGALAVNRWREDGTRDAWGSFCYLRDVASGDFWSNAHQPTCVTLDSYEAIFSDAKAEFRGRSHGFDMHTEIAVSAEDDIELRRLVLTNRSRVARSIEITSLAEVVLADALSDELHPAFSNLFVQTELVLERQAIICTRRPRSHDEAPPWMFHLMAVHDVAIADVSYETDRARFIGRGNSLKSPAAMAGGAALSNAQGSVLDPVVAIRCRIQLAPEQSATIDMVTGVSDGRVACAALIEKYRDRHLADRVFDLAWTHSQVVRRQINADQVDAQLYERLAGLVLFAHPAMRAEEAVLRQNRRGQSGLWGHAISGDLPIVLVRIADAANIELVRQMVQAHAYWRLKGLAVDLVIWNEDQAGYRQQLQDQIMGLIAAGVEPQVFDRPGGIFVRPGQQISPEDRVLLQAVARVIVSDTLGSLADQLGRPLPPMQPIPRLLLRPTPAVPAPAAAPPERPLLLDNGYGGFSEDGREYHIRLPAGRNTPMPWSNVLANQRFGTVVSESGCGYTWAENAHEYRLTPWHNDPVSDACGEAFYVRDEESGRFWSPTPLPRRGDGEYRTRHGFGYSVFLHEQDDIASELSVYVAHEDAVKFYRLSLHNRGDRERRLSATGYVEWVLGDVRGRTRMHVVTECDDRTGVLTARNAYHSEFGQQVGFFDVDQRADGGCGTLASRHAGDGHSFTADRLEFIGRNGSLQQPAALLNQRLSGRFGAGLDACAAIQVPVLLAPGASVEIIFRLGAGGSREEALALATRHRGGAAASSQFEAVRTHWSDTLDAVQVETPDPAVDLLVNGWLLYQTIACRYLARSGYYQSGGAFGFRDQLQDSMAMLHAAPDRARAHLLLSAAHQFPEGDVQHWWHPPLDRGVRTRCSDDYLWLPLAVCRYIEVTHDHSVLDVPAPYIEGRLVNVEEESYYDLPTRSMLSEPLYLHCVRALQRGLRLLGERGLPLIGTGDWNDGMNRVGERGRGESVWLGFFLFDVLSRFSPIAAARGEREFAERCLLRAEQLRQNLERHAWDGAWYRRAWFDDGTALGTAQGQECRIDSIAQSWSVLSSAADPQRARQAMDSLDQHLVRRDDGLVQLLQPPFDRIAQDPGYIRGYVPGVRENGGQYTHAAIWAAMAFAELGDSARAWELLRMINPINHARSAEEVAVYKVEPYVVAADVYAVAPHIGRGGWTWYTGSAGWMYRLITESLLGLRREGDRLRLQPCLPADWPGCTVRYRHRGSCHRIQFSREAALAAPGQVFLDGVLQAGMHVSLQDDGSDHEVRVVLPLEQTGR